MSNDIPAEFLPALPASRNRTSVGVRDARVEAMMAAMQQRPSSVRSTASSEERQRTPSLSRQSVDAGRVRSPSTASERPMSIRSPSVTERPTSIRSPSITERPMSVRSNSDRPTPRLELGPPADDSDGRSIASSVSRAQSISSRVEPDDLPVVMATPEADEAMLPIKPSKPAAFAASFPDNTPGNRNTWTLSDEELGRRLHHQMSQSSFNDGQLVTAEIVNQEIMDRREAERLLDEEILNLETAVMARQLDMPANMDDAGQAEDDAFRAAMAGNEKLDYMRPTSHKPWFSLVIFLVTTAAMAAEIGINQGVEPFSVNPTFGPKPDILLLMGAKRADLILAGEWWRLILPIILHAGILHLVFNMLGLWNIGVPMEREFGSLRIGAIYLLSGLFGVLMSCLFAPRLTSVGASGAIFGLFGAAWADLIQNWSLYKGSQLRMLFQLVLMTALNIVLGLMPFLDNYAHLGGLICGCILGLGVLVQTRYYYSGVKKRKRTYQIVLMAISFLALPSIFVAGYCVFFLRVPIDCDWCAYVSCVPMPPNVPYNQRWWNCDECSQGLAGQIDPTNNTLVFTCPNNASETIRQSFPPSQTIDSNLLIATCLAQCLGQAP